MKGFSVEFTWPGDEASPTVEALVGFYERDETVEITVGATALRCRVVSWYTDRVAGKAAFTLVEAAPRPAHHPSTQAIWGKCPSDGEGNVVHLYEMGRMRCACGERPAPGTPQTFRA